MHAYTYDETSHSITMDTTYGPMTLKVVGTPETFAANLSYTQYIEDAFEAFKLAHPEEQLLIVRVGALVGNEDRKKGALAYNGKAFADAVTDSPTNSAVKAVTDILAYTNGEPT